MRKGTKRLVVLLTAAILASTPAARAGTPPVVGSGGIPTLAPMLAKVLPAVVSIAVRGHLPMEENPLYLDRQFRDSFGTPEPLQFGAAGSGVIVDAARGYVLTTGHVVEGAEDIAVQLNDGRRVRGDLIGADPESDIALLQIAAKRLTALPLADSEQLRVGDFVVVVGNPFGLAQSVTSGIVSAVGRGDVGGGVEGFIQTDASLNPGDSGGPLVNLHGELVGINSAIVGPYGGNVGIGFAIPVNLARRVMTDLIGGAVAQPAPGRAVARATPEPLPTGRRPPHVSGGNASAGRDAGR